MNLKRVGIIAAKEIKDNLRDRRSILSSMGSVVIGPAITLLLIVVLGKTLFSDTTESPLRIPVAGAEKAPVLMEFLKQNNALIVAAPADPKEAVRQGAEKLVLIVTDDYSEDFSAGRPAQLQMVLDTSRQSAMMDVERTRNLISTYSQQLAAMRLMVRGVSPVLLSPLQTERVDVATPQTQALLFLNMMPYFVVLVVFTGGMYVILDSTAGERERGSLEPLLINPATRGDFVLGKLAASLPFATAAVALNLLAFAMAFNLFPIEDYIGFSMRLNVKALFSIFLLAFPMILLASAVQMIIASFARSFKEAQTYTSFLPLVPAIPGMVLAFLPVKANVGLMLIPTFGQQIIINQLMRSEPIDPTMVMVSSVTTLVLAFGLFILAVRLYNRERIILGGK